MVVKMGGGDAINVQGVCRGVARAALSGTPVVLVHGGSGQIERLARQLGIPQRTMTSFDGVSSRYTDEATMGVVTMALAGAVKPHLVTTISRYGADALGLTGLDCGLLRAKRKPAQQSIVDGRRMVVRDNRAGTVTSVNTDLLRLLLLQGHIPVVSPPAMADDGESVNVNADRAAAAIAGALGAKLLLLLTGAPGVLADPADEGTVLDRVVATPASNTVGGMGLKLVAAREALAAGVREVRIADGRCAEPAFDGSGTEVVLA